jgi:hypothetical protein
MMVHNCNLSTWEAKGKRSLREVSLRPLVYIARPYLKRTRKCQAPVAPACNPSYLEDRHWED